MKKQLPIWLLISKSLQQNVPVMLFYVLESSGSSPGRKGFCMAVNANGEMAGSIGGGIMEHKFVEMAKEKLKHDEKECSIHKQIHDKKSLHYQSGMICSGEQSNLVYRVKAEDWKAAESIINCIGNNGSGKLTLSNKGISFDEEPAQEPLEYVWLGEEKDEWIYEEQIGYQNNLYIVGSGHCALALSKIMADMDFYIHLYDDRENINTFLQNNFAHQKIIVNDYTQLKELIPSGEDSFVVVMTVGYRTDDIVVRTLIDKQFKYFGLLGSKKKIEKMFSDYRKEGIDEALLKKIHAPIGLQINSQTPEEIAISIAAEIIQVKNAPDTNKITDSLSSEIV
jgi:xanthine dehydrogenase accessory factor